jgi:hypothetical protein
VSKLGAYTFIAQLTIVCKAIFGVTEFLRKHLTELINVSYAFLGLEPLDVAVVAQCSNPFIMSLPISIFTLVEPKSDTNARLSFSSIIQAHD